MSNPLRSKRGCWTCRLRKKKCDEVRPECTTCVGLSITCYGYGPKPDWMDNGEAERRIASSLKQIVKYTSRRKPSARAPVTRQPALNLAPRSETPRTTSTSSSDTSHVPKAANRSEFGFSHAELIEPRWSECVQHAAVGCIPAEDSILLMHFLDTVFPLQYPAYQPEVREGGRGWLLALLLLTKPLYYAALALSSYHRGILISQGINERCLTFVRVQQGKHLEACLIEVQQAMKTIDQFIQNGLPSNGIGIVTSIVQLVFLELFTSPGGVWKTHLNAAIDVYHRNCKDKLAHLGLSQVARAKLCQDQCLNDEGAVVTQEVTTFRFIGGTIIWLDIISSITSGTVPRLLSYHQGVIASDSQTKLENIMGCRNWAMRQIGRIAALHGHRTHATQANQPDHTGFCQTVKDIGHEIEYGLTGEAFGDFGISAGDSTGLNSPLPDLATFITRMFAWMAVVYLHLVAHGFQKLENLDAPVSGAVRLLQNQLPSHIISAMVAPLFIIGCVARKGQEQDIFRSIYASKQFQDGLYKQRTEISSIVEEVWSRREAVGFAWEDVLGLAKVQHLLLL